MKLLFDQNLSRKLVTRLADIFPDSSHVQFHELQEKTDTEIWDLLEKMTFVLSLKIRILQSEAVCTAHHPKLYGYAAGIHQLIKSKF